MATMNDGDLWILAGETPTLLELAKTTAQVGSPFYGAPDPDPDAFVREGPFIRELLPDALRPALAPAIRAIAEGPAPVTLVRGRRQRPSYRFHLYALASDRAWTVLEMGDEAAGELWLRRTTDDVAEWVVRPLAGAYLPEDLIALPPLPESVAQVLLALAGLFLERFPDPDPNWLPTSLFTFTLEDVRRQLVAGYLGDSPDSLMAAVGGWLDHKWVALQTDEVEQQLAVMAFRRWIGIGAPDVVPEGQPVIGPDDYWVGHELTWWLRCLAWWDMNLVLRSPKDRLAVVQATYLYEFGRDGDRWTIGPVGPDRLLARAKEVLRKAEPWGEPSVPPPIADAPPPAAPPVARPRFCRECGAALREGASFCPNCGAKMG
ncbi:MAG: zinc ribbon domain-containing protein [Fimbriimonadaceae bacterium]|nr:zinc ribbon domain-containing protein [Fimbriimonadaceae bacterium]